MIKLVILLSVIILIVLLMKIIFAKKNERIRRARRSMTAGISEWIMNNNPSPAEIDKAIREADLED